MILVIEKKIMIIKENNMQMIFLKESFNFCYIKQGRVVRSWVNPLSPNINIQIFQTDLYTFP